MNAELLQQALAAHQAGRLEEARSHYESFLSQSGDHADAHYYLGMLHHQAGRLEAACNHVARSVSLDPRHADRFSDLGSLQVAAGEVKAGIAAFKEVIARAPQRVDVWAYLGDLLRSQGEVAEAIHCYESAVRQQPDLAEAWLNLGLLLGSVGRPREALVATQRAVRLRPDWAEAHNNLGIAFKAAGDYDAAQSAYRAALACRPDFPEVHNNLGLLLAERGRREAAIAAFNDALRLRPAYAEARVNLADVLRETGQVVAALEQYERALQDSPGDLVALWNLGNVAWNEGRHQDAAHWYERALAVSPDNAGVFSNWLYARLYDFGLPQEELLAAHREYSQRFEAPLRARWGPHDNAPLPERRLRIGYVSADFRSHPVAHFMRPVFAHHDKRKVEVFAYYNDDREDEFTRSLKAGADHWIPCRALSDDALAARIRADGIDVLVDLSGHTAGNRLPVFARKPAPVQITYLSYPGTSGLSAMDYRLTDAHADPVGSERWYSEQLLRLPHSLVCYAPADYLPAVDQPPCLRSGLVTFGSFNNYNKLTDECLKLWADLLQEVPTARMLFVAVPDGAARSSLLQRMMGWGIAEDRIEMVGKLPGPEFVASMRRADIALDPFPLTGGTTTMEALAMGLPTLVLNGDRFISRVGVSFLTSAGLPELIANTPAEYVEKAKTLAADPQRIARYRRELRQRLAASPLMDAAGFTAALEAAYRSAWTAWCERQR